MQFEEALKIYRKALSFSKENLSSNEQLVRNLTKVVNSATEQIEEQKRSLLANVNKTMVMKESTLKSDIYKDLSKKVDRYHRALPKLKVNGREHAALYEPSYQSVDYNEEEPVNMATVTHRLCRPARRSRIGNDSCPNVWPPRIRTRLLLTVGGSCSRS